MKNDETAAVSQYVAATSHYLESWGDLETKKGHLWTNAANDSSVV